jgi:SAM-dependent methyltransferase
VTPTSKPAPETADGGRLARIEALRLPPLGGLRFLDVACGDGLMCGFALADGAARVVGLGSDGEMLRQARERFPAAEFLAAGFDALPDGPFDVILLASALHLADDQADLVRRLMARLAPNGVLVLELGLASSERAEWKHVEGRGGPRQFPTLALLEQMLAEFAWKWMGPSVAQEGDSVRRHVVQVQHRRPLAYLLIQPPGYGKTSIARRLFGDRGVAVVSGDQVLLDIAQGRLAASAALTAAVKDGFSSVSMDRATERAFAAGMCAELVGLWLQRAGGGDFALDAFVPASEHEAVARTLAELGYLPVAMQWARPGLALASGDGIRRRAQAFLDGMATGGRLEPRAPVADVKGTVGHVDDLRIVDDRVLIRGWAIHESGRMPECLGIRIGRKMHVVPEFERQPRPDVRAHLGLSHDVCGFLAVVPVAALGGEAGLPKQWLIFGGLSAESMDGPFGVAARAGR